MPTLLHIQASPRAESFSRDVAEGFLDSFLSAHGDWRLDTLDLFADAIPEFRAPEAKAKYAVLGGAEPQDEAGRAWKPVVEAVDRLKAADALLISSPMWNFSIPYRLKQYIDVIVQPGLTFSYSPEAGYEGLVTGRPAALILARGGEYAADEAAHLDMQRPYLELILGFIGFSEIHTIVVEPTLMAGPAEADDRVHEAMVVARRLAKEFCLTPAK